MFENKYLVAPYDRPNLQRFLDLHPANEANGGGSTFRLMNKEANFPNQDIESEFKINDAISIIKSRPMDELLPVALALNIEYQSKRPCRKACSY